MIGVAIPAFNRPDLLENLLASLDQTQISAIYISIDGPISKFKDKNAQCVEVALKFKSNASIPVWVLHCTHNMGSAANVLGVIDFMFEREQVGAVIEDDCIPSIDFLPWAEECLALYSKDANLWAVCGTQFVPAQYINGTHVRSSYPLMWGWATSRSNWGKVRASLARSNQNKEWSLGLERLGRSEANYWKAGYRRSIWGYVDAWDIPIASVMLSEGLQVILPRKSLVTNVGDGFGATHTVGQSEWLRQDVNPMPRPLIEANQESSIAVDLWLRKRFFRISPRHIFSTRATRFMDLLFARKRVRGVLEDRLYAWNSESRIL